MSRKWTAYRGSYWYTLLYNSNGTSADLGNLGATLGTYGLGMNNGGDVVGMTNLASGVQHAFLYHGGVMGDLNSRVNNIFGWTLLMATNINDFGEIVCLARGPDGTSQAVVLFPVPVGV